MSTAPAEQPGDGMAPHGLVRFTHRGEEALDALVTDMVARCDATHEGIAELLDQVLHADVSQLASALTAINAPAQDLRGDEPLVVDTDLAQTPETADEAARRRLGRYQDLPAGGTASARSIDR
jgi:hypothetical protein